MTDDKPDLYGTLGVPRGASKQDIRKAYRRLARDLHPDRNDAPSAAERFKRVTHAYDVLSDDGQRKLYDEFGNDALRSNFNPEQARAAKAFHNGFGDFGRGAQAGGTWFDLDDLFGGARSMRHDLARTVALDFVDAVRGTRVSLQLPSGPATVNLPPGIEDGARLRVPGRGARGRDGRTGDLVLEVRVRPDARWRREGQDLHLVLPITIEEAMFGAKVAVETLDGSVKVTVPPGSQSGRRLRLAGKGVPGRRTGDLYAELRVLVPDVSKHDEDARNAARTLSTKYRDVR